jgi:hypothetical protein
MELMYNERSAGPGHREECMVRLVENSDCPVGCNVISSMGSSKERMKWYPSQAARGMVCEGQIFYQ